MLGVCVCVVCVLSDLVSPVGLGVCVSGVCVSGVCVSGVCVVCVCVVCVCYLTLYLL